MTDQPRPSGERTSAEQAPELHTAEQDDELAQAQTVAQEAGYKDAETSPLDSEKVTNGDDEDAAQDLIDKMRDMEQSGRIDMGAFAGEPNMDDNEDMYGEDNKLDDLPSDGSIGGNPDDEDD